MNSSFRELRVAASERIRSATQVDGSSAGRGQLSQRFPSGPARESLA